MAKEDLMNVSATNNEQENNGSAQNTQLGNVTDMGTKMGRTAGSAAKDITIRTGNRLKKGMKEFGKAASAFLAPLKKYLIIGGLIAVGVILFLIIMAAGLKYLLEEGTVEATNDALEKFEDARFFNLDYLYGYRGQTSDLDEVLETMEFYMGENNQVFTRVASTSRAKKVESLNNFLFIGDSRYEGADNYLNALGSNIKNAGVSSSNIGEWEQVAKQSGKGTVQTIDIDIAGTYAGISIQLGANGVYNNVDKTVNQMKSLIEGLRNLYPDTSIFVNSCIQVNPKASSNGYSWDVATMRDNITDFNTTVKEFCDMTADVYYIDVQTNLLDSEGYLKDEYTDDGLHCNAAGNQIFVDNIKTAIMNSEAGAVTVDSVLASMTPEEKIYQLMMVQSEISDGSTLADKKYGGYIAGTGSNYQNNLDKLGSNYKIKPFVSTDDEGGSVTRAATQYTTKAREYGDAKSYEQLKKDELEKSNYLLGLGINLNLGPVTDVISDSGAALYNRSFSGDTTVVEECIKTIVEARKNSNLNGISISSSLKHYPGYPDTSTNSDYGEAESNRSKEDIDKNIEVFKSGINSGAQSVMVSNVIYTNYDANNPASLSPTIIRDLRAISDDIVIMTDDIGQAAGVATQANRFARAIQAGNDMILLWDGQVSEAYNEINTAITNGDITEERINESVRRILNWKAEVGLLGNTSSSSSSITDNQTTTTTGGRTTETIVIKQNADGEYCIAVDVDEKIDNIYNDLKKSNNTLISKFRNEEQAKESLKLWAIAEFSSQYLNLSSDVENYQHDYDADYIQGTVKVKRYTQNDDGTETEKYLTYKTQEEFDVLKANYESSGDTTVFNHFTINAQDDLVIAKYVKTTQDSSWSGTKDPKGQLDDIYTKYEVSEQKLPYRNAIVQYAMPYHLFVALTMYGDNAEFTNAVARLITDSEMIIGIRDNVTTSVTTEYDRYLREEKVMEHANMTASASVGNQYDEAKGNYWKFYIKPSNSIKGFLEIEEDFETNSENTGLGGIETEPYYEKKTVKTVITNSVAMNIEYIDGWCFNHKIEYEAKEQDSSTGVSASNIENTDYETTQAYEKIKENLTDEDEIYNLMTSSDVVRNIHTKATDGLNRDQILLEGVHTRIANYLYTSGSPIQGDAYKVLQDLHESQERGLAKSIINGISWDFSALSDEKLNSLGITTDAETVKTEAANLYSTIYNGIRNSDNWDIKIINTYINLNLIEYGRSTQERIVNRTVTTCTDTNTKQYNKISTETVEKTEKNPEAGEENFVSILCDPKYRRVKQFLTGSTSAWFFETLERSSQTECLIDLLRYLFYKATTKDYGVTEFDFSKGLTIIDVSNFQSTGGALVGDTIQAKIWFGLKAVGYSDMQIAAAMGNFEHEAGFNTKNIENVAESTYGNDQEFTDGVNSGTITRDTFVNGTYINSKGKACIYGYGLAQWSAAGRKAGLYDYAKSKGASIDDENIQVEYLIAEITGSGAEGFASRAITESTMTDYTGTNYYARDWYNATSDELDENTLNHITLAFCYTFERPAVSAESEASRQAAALKYYNEFHGQTMPTGGGQYEEVTNDEFIIARYTSNRNGRTFSLYDQGALRDAGIGGDLRSDGTRANNWCNHATAACFASGYRDSSVSELDVYKDSEDTSCILSTVSSQNAQYFSTYSLEQDGDANTYAYSTDNIKSIINEGKYIALYFTGEVYGKSGAKYSQSGSAHWIGILDYRVENGVEQIFVANSVSSWGWGWKNLDEFDTCQGSLKYFTVVKEIN